MTYLGSEPTVGVDSEFLETVPDRGRSQRILGMRLHYLQHEPIETPGNILKWAEEHGFSVSHTRLYLEEDFPGLDGLDWLVVMGGAISANDESKYRWLISEKKFLEQAIDSDKKVLGVCLGAQLVASVLGARVFPNTYRELGWFPVQLTSAGLNDPVCRNIPSKIDLFHWHGETFDLPSGAIHLAKSEACANQAFRYGENVLAWQFHPEVTYEMVGAFVAEGSEELSDGLYIQEAADIIACREKTARMEPVLYQWLDNFIIND